MKRCFFLLAFLGLYFHQLNGEENFLLIDGSTNAILSEFGPGIYKRVTPASSFKIVLNLMGYDAGILKDEKTPTWEFQEGFDDFLDTWRTSQNPQTWMALSCIWFSKKIALQLSVENIQHCLSSFEYGNQDLSAGRVSPGPINPFWVSSSLKISPKEQVHFIQKMIQNRLPISNHALQMTKKLLFKEEWAPGWKLYGKTGLGSTFGENNITLKVRWFVGWLENDHNFFPFAYQVQEREVDPLQTILRVKQLLSKAILISL